MGEASWHVGEWERGPKHGWRAIHRVRCDVEGEAVEEEYVERSFVATVAVLPVVAALLWWWQARLDGWQHTAVVVVAVIASIYAIYLVSMVVLVSGLSRWLRQLID